MGGSAWDWQGGNSIDGGFIMENSRISNWHTVSWRLGHIEDLYGEEGGIGEGICQGSVCRRARCLGRQVREAD